MKSTKRIISLILSVIMIFGVCAVSVSVSADEQAPTIKMTTLTRWYANGEWPEDVINTSGGYVTMKEESYCKQKQVSYRVAYDNNIVAAAEEAIEMANDDDHEGVLAMQVNVIDCHATTADDPLTEEVELYKQNAAAVRCNIYYTYGYNDEPDEVYKGELSFMKWQGIGTAVHKMDATVFLEFDWFKVDTVLIGAMNYANPANSLGESGIGDFEIEFSPIYVYGEELPEKGEVVEFDPEAWSWETAEERNVLYAHNDPMADEATETTYTADGPYYEGLDIKRDEYGYPINAEGVVCDFEGNPLPDATIGDVNDDGNVNGKDVLALRKYIVGLIGEADINVDAADCNYDGNINGKDVLQLRKAIIGLVEL